MPEPTEPKRRGRKPLRPEERRTQRNYYLTDQENQQVQDFIQELRTRTRRQKET